MHTAFQKEKLTFEITTTCWTHLLQTDLVLKADPDSKMQLKKPKALIEA